MSDLFTLCFVNQAEERFLAFLVSMLKKILTADRGLRPEEILAAQNIMDVLEGWMPLAAGNGSLMLEVYRFGRLLVRLSESRLEVQFKPWRRTSPSMNYRWVLSHIRGLTGTWTSWYHDTDHTDLSALLRLAARLRGLEFETSGVVLVKWKSGAKAIPEPGRKWVELREHAVKNGEQPPRACHWLATNKENHYA